MNDILAILLPLLEYFEGCVLHAYKDWVGVWTIGFGETEGVKPGMVWTREYAEQRLSVRAMQFVLGIYKACPQLLNEPPHRVAACASLAYNIGLAGFRASSVCRYTTRRQYSTAERKFWLWDKAGGKTSSILVKRRHIESDCYMKQ